MKREDKWLCQTVKKKKSKKKDNPYPIHQLNPDGDTVLLNKEVYYNWAVGVYEDMARNNCMFTQEIMYLMCLCGALMFNGDSNE